MNKLDCERCPLMREVVTIAVGSSAPIDDETLWGVPREQLPIPEGKNFFDPDYELTPGQTLLKEGQE